MLHIDQYIYCHCARNMARNLVAIYSKGNGWKKAVVWLCVAYQLELRFIILLFCRASFVLSYTLGVKKRTADCRLFLITAPVQNTVQKINICPRVKVCSY